MRRKWFAKGLALFGLLFITLLFGCSDKETQSSNDGDGKSSGDDRFNLSIMTTSHSPEPPTEDSPALQAIEDFTNTDLDITFVPNSNYDERFNITLASGELPDIIMAADTTPSFISAVHDGAFWDLTDYVDDYENLSQMNDVVINNSSIDGRIYGIYRSRPLGRLAITIRQDWLENLGLEQPKTVEEFYNVLKAFSEDDPDGNGQDDTTGMVVSEYAGPWDIMQTWFGVPNQWGDDGNGGLQPHFLTPEYREALDFFKKIYDEGLVNEDFAVMDSGKWHDAFINGEAGVIVDVADAASRNRDKMLDADPSLEEDIVDVFGAVEGPNGLYNLPTTGYSGMFAISKTRIKTEEDLKKVLDFLDKMNSETGQTLATNGVEGEHYEIEDGKYIPTTDQSKIYEYEDLNQLLMFIPEDRFLEKEKTALDKKEEEVMKANEDIVVGNPAEPLISEIYSQRGQQLDNIIKDARIQYIVGQIDESGLDEAEKLWMSSGGEDYIKEINELYKEIQ